MFEAFITLPMLRDGYFTTEFNVLFDFNYCPGGVDKWTNEVHPNEYTLTRVQLEISDGVWADLNKEHWHLVQEACDEVCDAYYQKLGEE